jgi:hypothetical protein
MAPPPRASRRPPPSRSLRAALRRRWFVGGALCVVALCGLGLLRALAPLPGTRDHAKQMPWARPHVAALQAAWAAAAAGAERAPPGACVGACKRAVVALASCLHR